MKIFNLNFNGPEIVVLIDGAEFEILFQHRNYKGWLVGKACIVKGDVDDYNVQVFEYFDDIKYSKAKEIQEKMKKMEVDIGSVDIGLPEGESYTLFSMEREVEAFDDECGEHVMKCHSVDFEAVKNGDSLLVQESECNRVLIAPTVKKIIELDDYKIGGDVKIKV